MIVIQELKLRIIRLLRFDQDLHLDALAQDESGRLLDYGVQLLRVRLLVNRLFTLFNTNKGNMDFSYQFNSRGNGKV